MSPARGATGRAAVLARAALPAAVLIAAIGSMPPLGCSAPPAPDAPAARTDPVPVRTARVGGTGEGWIEVPGAVEAARAASLASRSSALVESVAAEEGAFVHAGDPLVRLDGRDVSASLEAAEAALRAARAQRDRVRALFGKDAATRQELDAAEAADAAAAAGRDAARAQIEYVVLRAPFDGWVTEKKVRSGDLALPGQTLLSVQGVGLLRVSATVSEGQATRLEVGQGVGAVLEDGSVVSSRVSVLGPAGDPSSRRFLVKSDLPKASGARVGSFARLRLPRGQEDPLPLVPARALFERGALTGVFVVEDGRARLRWISVGEPAGDAVVVRAGLAAGEEVVVDPRGLTDGAPVAVTPAGTERRP